MGQYYFPVNLDKQEYLNAHDFGNELKLTEQSWFSNNFVEAVEKLLTPNGKGIIVDQNLFDTLYSFFNTNPLFCSQRRW